MVAVRAVPSKPVHKVLRKAGGPRTGTPRLALIHRDEDKVSLSFGRAIGRPRGPWPTRATPLTACRGRRPAAGGETLY